MALGFMYGRDFRTGGLVTVTEYGAPVVKEFIHSIPWGSEQPNAGNVCIL